MSVKAYLGRLSGRHPISCPKYRWTDRVEADLREVQAY